MSTPATPALTLEQRITASAILIIAVRQQLDAIEAKKNAKLAKNTNDLVNGQHGKALETIKSLSDHSEQEKGG